MSIPPVPFCFLFNWNPSCLVQLWNPAPPPNLHHGLITERRCNKMEIAERSKFYWNGWVFTANNRGSGLRPSPHSRQFARLPRFSDDQLYFIKGGSKLRTLIVPFDIFHLQQKSVDLFELTISLTETIPFKYDL